MNRLNRILAASAASIAAIAFSPASLAACKDCGTVVDVKTIKKEGEGSGVGAVAGGVLGGVIGHQIGSGRGNTAATVVGAGAGAYAGHQVEKSQKSTTTYQVIVKMDEGNSPATRTFTFANPTSYKVGDAVKIVDKKLVRR
jgi:outer membrane lipoprotein SlyB